MSPPRGREVSRVFYPQSVSFVRDLDWTFAEKGRWLYLGHNKLVEIINDYQISSIFKNPKYILY